MGAKKGLLRESGNCLPAGLGHDFKTGWVKPSVCRRKQGDCFKAILTLKSPAGSYSRSACSVPNRCRLETSALL